MGETKLEVVVKNIDRRLEKVEQFLPQLATKDELRAAIAPLATKDELRTSIAAAVAPLATRELVEEKWRHTKVLFESLQDSNRLIAESIAHLTAEVQEMKSAVWPRIDEHEVRLLALESGRATRRRPEPSR